MADVTRTCRALTLFGPPRAGQLFAGAGGPPHLSTRILNAHQRLQHYDRWEHVRSHAAAMSDEHLSTTEADRDRFQAAYAVAMRLHAFRKRRICSLWVSVAAVVATLFTGDLWWLAIGFALTWASAQYIMWSCERFVRRATGMPPALQHAFFATYLTDRTFALEVDGLYQAGLEFIRRA